MFEYIIAFIISFLAGVACYYFPGIYPGIGESMGLLLSPGFRAKKSREPIQDFLLGSTAKVADIQLKMAPG